MNEATFLQLIEAASDARGGRWRVRVIRAGMSGNRNFYPDAVLREATPLFDHARVFVKGDAEHLAGKGKDFRNLIGELSNPAFVAGNGQDIGEVHADLALIETDGAIARKLREAWDRKMTGLFGLSIDAEGRARQGTRAGKPVRETVAITAVNSVDLIVEPGAGGGIINLLESKGATMDHLSKDTIKLRLIESKLPEAAQARLLEDFEERDDVTEDELREAVKRERTYLAKFTESGLCATSAIPRACS